MPDNKKSPEKKDDSKKRSYLLKKEEPSQKGDGSKKPSGFFKNDDSSQNGGNPKKPTDSSNKRTTIIMTIIFVLVLIFVGSQVFSMTTQDATDNLDTGQFIKAVEQGRVESVVYAANDYTVSGTYYPASTAGNAIASAFNTAFDAINIKLSQARTTTDTRLPSINTVTPELFNLGSVKPYTSVYVGADSLGELLAKYPNIQYRITLPNGFASILISLLPFVLIAALLVFFFSQMQKANNSQLSFGKNKAKKTTEERPDVKFSDVAGVDEAVEEMQEVKDFLANPKKYQSIGAKIPRGCLLVGPPGTGKTLLARAVAGEAGVPFFSISGSDFVEMFVGVGASRVRDLFKDAKEAAPSIIFIDEIDAVGRQRGTGLGGGHDEREQTLNQLLVEMDGFEANESVVLIAATNRSDVLDPALLRPGRFDRQIVVDTPDVKGRERILQVHSADKPISSDVDLASIAKITPGFTGADLANLMNEAALLTARKSKKIITMREVNESLERVIAGPERKGRVLNEHIKRTIAYHESGHALVGHLLNDADPVHKISIISRGRALGYTLSIPDDDKPLKTLSEMRDELAVFMGGRVAEEIFCDDITTGASNDLERASKMARAIVTQYGMSPLGTQVFGQPNHEVFLGRDYGNTQDYSDETARLIDDEVSKIMKEAHDRAHRILTENAVQMDLMASVLLERETVEGEACQALLDNKWPEYLERESEIIATHEREEAEARARDLAENPDLTAEDLEGKPIDGTHITAPNPDERVTVIVKPNEGSSYKLGNKTEEVEKADSSEKVHEPMPLSKDETVVERDNGIDDSQLAIEEAKKDNGAVDTLHDLESENKDGVEEEEPVEDQSFEVSSDANGSSELEMFEQASVEPEEESAEVSNENISAYDPFEDTLIRSLTVGKHERITAPTEINEDEGLNLVDDSPYISFEPDVTLKNPDWREARVEPGDQDPNGPYWQPAINADKSDDPTQAEIDAEIEREDEMLSSPEAPDPVKEPFANDEDKSEKATEDVSMLNERDKGNVEVSDGSNAEASDSDEENPYEGNPYENKPRSDNSNPYDDPYGVK